MRPQNNYKTFDELSVIFIELTQFDSEIAEMKKKKKFPSQFSERDIN